MSLELTPSVLLDQLQLLFSKLVPAETASANTKTSNLEATTLGKNNPIKRILVAYSGGLDSHVLLHLLASINSDEFELRAIYINHGLQSEAVEWANHCNNICQDLAVPYTCVELNLSIAKGESVEEVARKARYESIHKNLLKDEILVTAHHQNDQAETLLLQLFRGAGVQGLASMPVVGEFRSENRTHFHIRPLLSASRTSLELYAQQHHLKHIEDPSNKDTTFDRNFLRQDIMPLLRERWLGLDKTISRAASIQAETKSLLDELASDLLPDVLSNSVYNYSIKASNKLSLAPIDILALREHSLPKQRLLLRYWITQQGFMSPSDTKLTHVFSNLIEAADDKQPLLKWSGVELRRYQQHLYIMSSLTAHDESQIIFWNTDQPLEIPSLALIIDPTEIDSSKGDSYGINDDQDITVRFRQGGEKIEIAERGNISLKNLLQEHKVPPWMRSRLPLIYQEDKLIKIIGLDTFK